VNRTERRKGFSDKDPGVPSRLGRDRGAAEGIRRSEGSGGGAREEVQEEKRLVAYYTVAETEDETAGGRVRGEELRAYLRQSLRVHGAGMVRATRAVAFDGEREGGPQGVARPEGEGFAVRGYEAPEGKIETIIAGFGRCAEGRAGRPA